MDKSTDFVSVFEALTGNPPFPWQEKMFALLVEGKFDEVAMCNLPTGLGKTSIIPIWAIALAHNPEVVPRRLAYVVNRRTVVDQSTAEAEKIRENLKKPELAELRKRLLDLFTDARDTDDSPLAISTLRGQFADNGEWCANPARPAVVVGTVDMIGSRLLFSGYGIGFKKKPLHAGFLGQDSLIVHDEAHLEPAFQVLLESIENEQNHGRYPDFHSLRVMTLTATSRSSDQEVDSDSAQKSFVLTEKDRKHPVVNKRICAKKNLYLEAIDDEKKIADTISSRALKLANDHPDAAILIFVRKVEDVDKIREKLRKEAFPIEQLTGTLRGKERDELVDTPIFQRFLPPSNRKVGVEVPKEAVFLICTSAGEVGVDISADHLVCDLSTFDSMAQRFGRVNRYGNREDTEIHVIHPIKFDKDKEIELRREKTLELLCQLKSDASPAALNELPPKTREEAFSPPPTILKASDILFDAWALTSVKDELPGRPPVEPYLHGLSDWEPPQTQVAWRKDVELISGGLLERCQPEELLDDYPLKPHELLHDRSDRVFDNLQKIASRYPNKPVWMVNESGSVTITRLEILADPTAKQSAAKKPLIEQIERKTILLPPCVGGLNAGMLDGTYEAVVDDIADIEEPETEQRFRIHSGEDDSDHQAKTKNMRKVRSIELGDENDEASVIWDWYKYKTPEDSRTARKVVEWSVHIGDVERTADRILAGLHLPDDLAQAVHIAASLHDHGKRRLHFQLMLGNRNFPDVVWAKSGGSGTKLQEIYRHEFGSLADAPENEEFQSLSSEMQDLALHLIAASHGRARPHFQPNEAFDPMPGRGQISADLMACEVPRRFARLQRQYGRWGLAYLESLLRAADWAASATPSQDLQNKKEEQ